MLIVYGLTIALVIISFAANPKKAKRALRIAFRRFAKVAPSFLLMLMAVALALSLMPEGMLEHVFSHNGKWLATGSAAGIGAISVMPGFVAFPLCGILLERGALYMVLSAFTTTLMMVGIVSFPLEKAYLGTRLTLARNIAGFAIAIVVALITGVLFGEI